MHLTILWGWHLTLMHKMGLRRPKHSIFSDQFYSKNARELRFHVFLYFNARKHDVTILPEVDRSSGPWGPTNGKKLRISCKFGPPQVK